MFYMKCNGKKLEIREDNVYTTCPRCGKEHKVDLCDILADGNSDLYGTQVYCQKCSMERAAELAKEVLP